MNTCEYCLTTKGQIEWHHPIKAYPEVGLYLCQPHHSLIQGRKHAYMEEADLEEDRQALILLVNQRVRIAGFNPDFDIDKR